MKQKDKPAIAEIEKAEIEKAESEKVYRLTLELAVDNPDGHSTYELLQFLLDRYGIWIGDAIDNQTWVKIYESDFSCRPLRASLMDERPTSGLNHTQPRTAKEKKPRY